MHARNATTPAGNGGRAEQQNARGADRSALSAYLGYLAASGAWVPWAELLDAARHCRGLAPHNDLHTWRLVRPAVLDALARLGLVAIVEQARGPVPIEHHHADAAGLVRVHRVGWSAPSTVDPREIEGRRGAYLSDVGERFGLRLVPGIPRSLRAFCGQDATTHAVRPVEVIRPRPMPCRSAGVTWDGGDYRPQCGACEPHRSPYPRCGLAFETRPGAWRMPSHAERITVPGGYVPAWLDHVAAWIDSAGRPVLSVDVHEAERVATAVVADVEGEGLPLLLDGPHADVWDPGSSLLLWRLDPSAPVLPSRFAPDVAAIAAHAAEYAEAVDA